MGNNSQNPIALNTVVKTSSKNFTITNNGNKKVINHFRLQISNQSFREEKYRLNFDNPVAHLITATSEIVLQPKEFKEVHFFIEGPASTEFINQTFLLTIKDSNPTEQFSQSFPLKIVGPKPEDKL